MESAQDENPPAERLIRIGEAKRLTGLSTATLYRKVATRDFPGQCDWGRSHERGLCPRFRTGLPDGSNWGEAAMTDAASPYTEAVRSAESAVSGCSTEWGIAASTTTCAQDSNQTSPTPRPAIGGRDSSSATRIWPAGKMNTPAKADNRGIRRQLRAGAGAGGGRHSKHRCSYRSSRAPLLKVTRRRCLYQVPSNFLPLINGLGPCDQRKMVFKFGVGREIAWR
jgi:predicted DNA-binding transcriptional regulator AlpA